MNDRVIQGFPERQLDCVFPARDAMRSFDESHQPFHQRRDRANLALYPSVNFEQGARASASKRWPKFRSHIRWACVIQDSTFLSAVRQPQARALCVQQPESLAI